VIGLDLWCAHVSVTGQHLRVHRLWHGRLFTRDEIEGVEVGVAVGMMVAGQRTLVLHAHAEPFYIGPLARYASPKSEQLLTRQRDVVVATLHIDDR
ncbi:MAG: hypothetical protein JWN87_2363, partial [Frankiales bacterium]|nr:hypothetical protein [Frankiales bacterium]